MKSEPLATFFMLLNANDKQIICIHEHEQWTWYSKTNECILCIFCARSAISSLIKTHVLANRNYKYTIIVYISEKDITVNVTIDYISGVKNRFVAAAVVVARIDFDFFYISRWMEIYAFSLNSIIDSWMFHTSLNWCSGRVRAQAETRFKEYR